jgi:hypothetical protein
MELLLLFHYNILKTSLPLVKLLHSPAHLRNSMINLGQQFNDNVTAFAIGHTRIDA